MRTLYLGTFIDTPGPDELRVREGVVLVNSNDGHGIIEKVNWDVKDVNQAKKAFELDGEDVEVVVQEQGQSRFWFPGFIDTHIHAPQYPNVGIFGKSTLLDWLETYTFPLESSLGSIDSPMYKRNRNNTNQLIQQQQSSASGSSSSTPRDLTPDPLARAKTVYSRIITRTLSHGTTTASYYATIHVPATNLLADLAFQRGQRAYIGRVCMDQPSTCPDFYRDESTEDAINKTISTIDHCTHLDPTSTLIAPIITPRFAPSCTPSTLSALGDLAKSRNIRVQTHLSENTNELALVANLFPDAKHYTDVYATHGLLTPRTILAHAIHLSTHEIDLIRSTQSKISHCPASNSALGSGLCPVRKWLDSGLDVGLGTDVSGGYSPSILEAVRQSCLVSRQVSFLDGNNSALNISLVEGLWLATRGGAKVVDMADHIGLIEPGMFWDVQEIQIGHVVDAGRDPDLDLDFPVDIFGWEDWEEKIAKWVWNGDDRNVMKVWVGGRLVHERK